MEEFAGAALGDERLNQRLGTSKNLTLPASGKIPTTRTHRIPPDETTQRHQD